MIETYNNETSIVTKGSQQSRLLTIFVLELKNVSFVVNITPNLAGNYIHLYIDNYNNYKDINYKLFDINRKMVIK